MKKRENKKKKVTNDVLICIQSFCIPLLEDFPSPICQEREALQKLDFLNSIPEIVLFSSQMEKKEVESFQVKNF